MAASKITYDDKIQGVVNPAPIEEKYTFGNANEVKNVVNEHADLLDIDDSVFDVIEGENPQEAFSSVDTLLLNARSTGVIYGGDITINGGDNSKVDVASASGQILDNTDPQNPVFYRISYAGDTAITIINTGTPLTYWYLDNTGTLNQSTTAPTRSQQRTRIYLGRTSFSGGSVIAAISTVTPTQQIAEQFSDLIDFLDMLKSGLNPSNAGSDLTIQISAGEVFDHGANFWNDATDPHVKQFALDSPSTFQMATENGGSGIDTTDLDVGNYDLNGVITAIGGSGNRSSIFTVYKFPTTGSVRVQYDNTFYNSLTLAEEALQTGLHSVALPPVFQNAVVLGYIITTRNETDLSNASFTSTNIFGELGGGVSGLTGTYLEVSNNLSDVPNKPQALLNLGAASEKAISQPLRFVDLVTFFFTQGQDFKINSITEKSGVTATIKIGGTATDYVFGDTVTAFDELDITVDVPGSIVIIGELV